MTSPPLVPGFMVVHGNHPEHLRDVLLAWLARHPLPPLDDELVLVQSNGIAQWLKLSMAAEPQDGGIGIAAALRTELPSAALWQVYRAVLGPADVPAESALDKARLVWRLLRLLPTLLPHPAFAPLRQFLQHDPDGRKAHQLAVRVADLFDQYQVYRADWLADWAQGRDMATRAEQAVPVPPDLRWQPLLWRALLDDVGAAGARSSRADVHRRFLAQARAEDAQRPPRLPARIAVFGVSSLPQQALEVLAAAARWSQVLLCVHNPCEHDWSHIVADQHLLRAQRLRQRRRPGLRGEGDGASLHLHGHPLLAAWGRQGRDFIRLLDLHDEREAYEQRFAALGLRVDRFEANARACLLQQLQDDIRELRPLAETRTEWPPVDPRVDRSIAFHVTHGAQREVEVLYDQLLAAFAADDQLKPRDVIVMVPDIATYAPHVQAVFGLVERNDRRHIPFTIADQPQRQHDPLLGAIEQLLQLPESRLAVSDVLDLLELPAVRARFGIEEGQLPLLHRWIGAARIRWGLHAEHRARLDLPEGIEQNSWAFGLRRMLLGYAVGGGQAWAGIEPLDEIGGLDAALLGPLLRLVETLEAHWRSLREPAAAPEWAGRLRALLADFFAAGDGSDDGFTLLRLKTAVHEWEEACHAAGLAEPLPLAVVRDHWLERLEPPPLHQPFFSGGVTFASLMPMRAIPFRWVALLGMNDGDYPRSRVPMDFDLMAQDFRPGDRSRREDDRYLFLEAVLSAREHLHVSWVGRSIHDNEARPPSVLVAQLRDHLAGGWRTATGEALLPALTVEHRLQPFHPAYFDGRSPRHFSHAREWRASLSPPEPPTDSGELAPLAREHPLTLRLLGDFAKDPVRSFFRERLGVEFGRDDAVAEDQEPFELDALRNWQLQDELIQAQKAAVDAQDSREAALELRLERLARRGELPLGPFAQRVREELARPMAELFGQYAKARADWPQALPDEHLVRAFHTADGELLLDDWLADLRGNAAGQRARIVLASSGLVQNSPNRWRLDKLLPHWVAHLAAHCCGEPLTTVVLSKVGCPQLPPLAPAQAERHLAELLQAWQVGMRRPLPFAVESAGTWLRNAAPGAVALRGDRAWEAARRCYEPDFEGNGECARKDWLARAYPGFDALWADGEFEHWAELLLRPLLDCLGQPPWGAGK